MKQLKIKFLSSLLITVSALCMSFLTANAQSGTAFLSPEFQYKSGATYDQSNNPTDSTVYIYTKNGYPFGKEVYSWDYTSFDNVKKTLASTCEIINDTGNDFTVKLSLYDEDGAEEEITQIAYNCNDIGEVQKMVSTSMLQSSGMSTTTTMQYWRTANRLDSILSTTTVDGYDFTSTVRTIYKTYDADGRPTLEEMYFSSSFGMGTHSEIKFAYFKNASGQLEREEAETDQYNQAGALELVSKDVTYFDAKERPIRTEEYSGPTVAMLEMDAYTIYHYDGGTGIVNPRISVQTVIADVLDGCLSVNSSTAERIEIYSVSGEQVYANTKPAGEIQISINRFPHGIYLVKGSSGWVKKIVR